MPKYKIAEERLSEGDIPIYLQAIANELAEANRLKRLELSHFQPLYMHRPDSVKSDSLLNKDLEDKA